MATLCEELLPEYSKDGVVVECCKNSVELFELELYNPKSVYGLGGLIGGILKVRPRAYDIEVGKLGVKLFVQIRYKTGWTKTESLCGYVVPIENELLEMNNDYIYPFTLEIPYYTPDGELLPPGVEYGEPNVVYKVISLLVPVHGVDKIVRNSSINVSPEYEETEVRRALCCDSGFKFFETKVLNTMLEKRLGFLTLKTCCSPKLTCFDPTWVALYADYIPGCASNSLNLEINRVKYTVTSTYKKSNEHKEVTTTLDKKEFTATIPWYPMKNGSFYSAPLIVPIQPLSDIPIPSFTYKNTKVSHLVTITVSTNYGPVSLSVPAIAMDSPPAIKHYPEGSIMATEVEKL